MIQKKAKLTQYDNGKIVIEPYVQTNSTRYAPLLELEYGALTTTQQYYRLLLKFPRNESILEIIRHLFCETRRIGEFLIDLYSKGGIVK